MPVDDANRRVPLGDVLHRPLTEQTKGQAGLSGVERTIEGVSAGNLLGVLVERIPRRVFDTSAAV